MKPVLALDKQCDDGKDIYDEIVQELYGIDPKTFKLDNVAVMRRGKIFHWTDRGFRLIK